MRILILCTGNSARSQMAEGILRGLDSTLDVLSAGTRPASQVNPLAVQVMSEIGHDISHARPRDVEKFTGESFDYVITVCDNAAETCPVFAGDVRERLHIGFPDPHTVEEFRAVRDGIRQRFGALYATIGK